MFSLQESHRVLRMARQAFARGLQPVSASGLSEFLWLILRSSGKISGTPISRTPEWMYLLSSSRCGDGTHPLFRNWAVHQMTGTGGLQRVPRSSVAGFQVPLPPLEVQREIVAEIEGYQKVIDGARAVVENYRPHIAVDPEWPVVALGEVCYFKRGPFGGSLRKEIFVQDGYAVYEQGHAISQDFSSFRYFINEDKYQEMQGFIVRPKDLIMSCSGTMGRTAIVPDNAPPGIINQALLRLHVTGQILTPFLKLWMDNPKFQQSIENVAFGAAIRNVASVKTLKALRIPLPPLETQELIVAELNAEQALIEANRELICRFEGKIQAAIARVWGEAPVEGSKDAYEQS